MVQLLLTGLMVNTAVSLSESTNVTQLKSWLSTEFSKIDNMC